MKLILDDTCYVCKMKLIPCDVAMLLTKGRVTNISYMPMSSDPEVGNIRYLPTGKIRINAGGRGFKAILCEDCANEVMAHVNNALNQIV